MGLKNFLLTITGITAFRDWRGRVDRAEQTQKEIREEQDYPFGRPSAPPRRAPSPAARHLVSRPAPQAPSSDDVALPLALHVVSSQAHFGHVATPAVAQTTVVCAAPSPADYSSAPAADAPSAPACE